MYGIKDIEILHKAGIANPLRLRRVIYKTIDSLNLDLKNLTVLTEAASGPYAVTPIIAAVAGADRVLALTRDSSYATVDEVKEQTRALEKICDVSDRIDIFTERTPQIFSQADIITNLGFVRPLDSVVIAHMKSTAVIPLMCETWEFREGDVDIATCNARGIKVYGTNEDYPGLEVFSYSAWLCMKLLHDAHIEIHKSKITIVSTDKFGVVIEKFLACNGINVFLVPKVDVNCIEDADALVIADYTRDDQIIGDRGDVTAEEIFGIAPHLTIVQFAGIIDIEAVKKFGLNIYPGIELPSRRMVRTLGELGPSPVVELHAAGLKVGEYIIKTKSNKLDTPYKGLCQNLNDFLKG
ncbi:MAG: hypothetical protein NDI81_08250 [Desulfobacula sp.]|nr:hypothetical protein [Desulfobacula sp.]